jgi:hypothetical protein
MDIISRLVCRLALAAVTGHDQAIPAYKTADSDVFWHFHYAIVRFQIRFGRIQSLNTIHV